MRFASIFFFRRLLMVFVLVLLPFHRNTQIVTSLWSTLFVMSYIGYVLPFANKMSNVQEIVNEWSVIIACYHLFCFTEWIYDYDRRIECGWSMLVVIALNVCFNVILLCITVVKSFYKSIKRKIFLRSYNKMSA